VRGTVGREDEEDLRRTDREACQLHFRVMKRLDINLINAQSPYEVEESGEENYFEFFRGYGGSYGGVNDFPPLREGEVESRRPWEDRRGAGLGGSRRRSSGLRRPRARTPAMGGTGALA